MYNDIVCPQCNQRALQHIFDIYGSVWTCWNCDEDFTTNELVINWGYDVADFYIPREPTIEDINSSLELAEYNPEPKWKTIQERNDAYEMVQRMLLNIPEIDEFMDARNSLPYPVGNVGKS